MYSMIHIIQIMTASWLFILICAFGPRPCLGKDLEQAMKQFNVGVDLFTSDDYLGALLAFEDSYRLKPKASVLFNIAMCQKALDRYLISLATFERYLSEAGQDLDPDIRKKVNNAIAEMKLKTGKLCVLDAPDQSEVWVDGKIVAKAPIGDPIIVDPGKHAVQVLANGFHPFNLELHVEPGIKIEVRASLKPIETPLPEKPKETAETKNIIAPKNALILNESNLGKSKGKLSSKMVGSIVCASVGLGAGVLGIYFTVQMFDHYNRAIDTYDILENQKLTRDEHIYQTDKYNKLRNDKLPIDKAWTIAGYTTAGSLLAASAILFILDRRDKKHPSQIVTPTLGGVNVRF